MTPEHDQSSEQGLLTIHASGQVPLVWVRMYLDAIESAYNALVFLEEDAGQFVRIASIDNAYARSQALSKAAFSPSFSSRALVLRRVHLESPGTWEFFGKLSPLETLREFINDRHRRKIENAKLPHEIQALQLDNKLRELDVIQKQIEIAKSAGISQRRLKSMMRVLIDRPLNELATAEQNGTIEQADLHEDDTKKLR